MAKTKISEFDIDPANNTDINSINIAEGCAPSGINNAIRQLMSDLKEFQTGAGGDSITATGVYSDTIGEKTSAAGVTVDGVLIKDNAVTASGGFSGALNGAVGGTTPAAGAFTTLSASGAFSANGGATLGDASGDALTINSSAVSIPNGLNFDSNTFVIDATNNRVGINVASPSTPLDVVGQGVFKVNGSGTTTPLILRNNDTTSVQAVKIGFDSSGSIKSSINAAVYGNDYMTFNVGSDTERMRIDSSGYLLVGTTSASFGSSNRGVVEVNGTTDSIFGLKVNGSTAGYVYANATDLNVLSESTRNATFGTPSSGYAAFKTNNTERMRITSAGVALIGKTATGLTTQGIQLVPAGSSAITGPSGSVPLYINNIGTSSQSLLEFRTGTAATTVAGSITTDGTNLAINGYTNLIFGTNSTTERMRIDSSGNVGIGTSSPQAALHVSKPAAVFRLQDSDGSAYNEIASGDDGSLYLAADASNVAGGSKIQFLVDNTARMTLDSSGNLGLGVTPSAWTSGVKAIQLTQGSSLFSFNSGTPALNIYSNAYYNGTDVIRIATGYVSAYQLTLGQHQWFNAPSGTAGTTASLTQAMTLDASGNLGIGTTSPSSFGKLTVTQTSGSTVFQLNTTTNGVGTYVVATNSAGVDNWTYGGYVNYGTTAASPIVFNTNSTERMRIDSSGNLFIGGTGVGGGQTFKTTVFTNTASTVTNNLMLSNKGAGTGAGVRLSMSGYDNSDRGAYIEAAISSGANGHHLAFATQDAGAAPTEKMRIDVSGNLLVGTTSPNPFFGTSQGSQLGSDYVGASRSGNPCLYLNRYTSTGTTASIRYAGTEVGSISVTASATAYNTSSDYRLKENVAPMTGALAKNALLKPVTYTWKVDGSAGEGFIAHELAEVMPQAVTGEKDAVDTEGNPVYQGIDTSFLVGHLVACIQELKAEVDSLKAQLNK